jgi:tRNA nucleotidyltransferase/poly(A) polymerase
MALIVTSSPRRKTIPGTKKLEKIVRAFARRQTGNPVYLVGGAVRDRLLGLPVSDFDFAVARGEADLARELEGAGFGRAVRISPESSPVSVWRLAGRGLTADIARFEKDGSIEDDLARRDFTANAIARDVVSERLVDPFGGRADIRRKRIRMIAPANLDADPIRILRAYRLAAALEWTIAPRTRAAIAQRSATLAGEAKERIRGELVRLFGARRASRPIAWASSDGVLAACLGLTGASPAAIARLLSPFDAPRLEERLRFPFRLATLLFRSRGAPENVGTDLVHRGFSRIEAFAVATGARFLAAAFSGETAPRVLFEFREQWQDLRVLLRLAARNGKEKKRARALAARGRRCNFGPAPVDGRDIAHWLAIPPGQRLGRELGRAAFLYFTGEARTRAEIERAVRSFDGARAEE